MRAQTHTSAALQMSGNTLHTGVERCMCAAACRRHRRDLVTAGENRICQTRATADEEKHRSVFHKAGQSENRPTQGTKTATEQRRTCTHVHERAQAAENRAVWGQTHAHASSGGVLGCVWLACAHKCVCVCGFPLSFQPAFVASPCMNLCVRVCISPSRQLRFPILTVRHRMQRQIRV